MKTAATGVVADGLRCLNVDDLRIGDIEVRLEPVRVSEPNLVVCRRGLSYFDECTSGRGVLSVKVCAGVYLVFFTGLAGLIAPAPEIKSRAAFSSN